MSTGFKNNDACLNKVADDEPIFVLRAKDALAPVVVEWWAFNVQKAYCDNGREIPDDTRAKLDEALNCAAKMRQWALRYGNKIPD